MGTQCAPSSRVQGSVIQRQNRHYCRLDWLAGDFDVFAPYVNIDLGADAELAGQINAGFDRETNAGCDAARVARLEVVDVDAVTVDFFADGMAGAMCEIFPITRSRDHSPRDIIHIGA